MRQQLSASTLKCNLVPVIKQSV